MSVKRQWFLHAEAKQAVEWIYQISLIPTILLLIFRLINNKENEMGHAQISRKLLIEIFLTSSLESK